MRSIHFGVMAITLSVLAVILTGCSLSLTNPKPQSSELEWSEGWVISQGEEPQVCEQEISRQEARKEAQEALKTEEEAQELQKTLASLGKRLMVWRAQGCEVKTEEGNNSSSQGLMALSQGEGTILVEVPAGADAALYLLEDESAGEGNYWASLKESLTGGERLTHIEVGLEEETEVQGLSEGVGQMSFFLPDKEGTQEIAGQVQKLLQGDSNTSGAGVSGMEVEGLDWGNAEVLLLDDASEEQEALLVVPAQAAVGQRLWDRGRPPIDEDQALYVKMRVKKTTPQGSSRPQLQVVRPTPERPVVKPVVRRGAELKPAFRYCPYRYYGRLSPFGRMICQGYEDHWYQKDWEYHKRPRLYNDVAQTYVQVSQALGKPGIAFFPDPKMSVLLAGFKDPDLKMVNALRKLAIEKGYLRASEVEGQGVELLCVGIGVGFSLPPPFNFVNITLAGISLCGGEALDFIRQFVSSMNSLPNPEGAWTGLFQDLAYLQSQCSDPSSCMLGQFLQNNPDWQDPQKHPGLSMLFNSLYNFVYKITGSGTTAILGDNFLQYFLYKVKDQALMNWMIQQFGPMGVLMVGWIDGLRTQGLLNPGTIGSSFSQFPYPDSISFFQAIKTLYDYAQNSGMAAPDIFRRDLESLVLAQLIYGAGRNAEQYYRTQEAIRLANQILNQGQGWKLERIWYPLCDDPLFCNPAPGDRYVDIIATKGENLVAYIMIEPFLSSSDVSSSRYGTDFEIRLWRMLELAVYTAGPSGASSGRDLNVGRDKVIFIVFNSADPDALECLKSKIQAKTFFHSVTIIIVVNGQVVWSFGEYTYSDVELCISIGLCSSQPATSTSPKESPPSGDPAFTVGGVTVNSCEDPSGIRFSTRICAQRVNSGRR